MRFTIPKHEVDFHASRSSGPGGQHVNKTSTRIEARWNVMESQSLSDQQRSQVLHRLAHRIDHEGNLRVVASETRSQLRNREAALARLDAMVAAALKPRKRRKKTRPTAASRERRLALKRQRSERKRERKRTVED